MASKGFSSVLIAVITLVILAAAAIAFIYYQKSGNSRETPSLQDYMDSEDRLKGSLDSKNSLPKASFIPEDNSNLDWVVYTSNEENFKFQINHPKDIKIDKTKSMVVFYFGDKIETPPNSPIDPYPPTSMAIYYRNDLTEADAFETKDSSIAGYPAKVHETPYNLDFWLASTNDNAVRISTNKTEENKSLDTFKEMISSFRFLE